MVKKRTLLCALACLFSAANVIPSLACTNVLISKGASADGSCMISYSADSHQLFGELYFHPAAKWPAGAMMDVTEWDTGRHLGQIPQVLQTYQTVGNMNEHQLIIGETTFGGRSDLYGQEGKMDYGSMIYIALQRARTAREAIKVMTDLANDYGYVSEGESFSIADKNEVWLLEVMCKGKGEKGIVWVARRVPDGYICSHANQARISTFPLNDPENCLYSEDVITFARKKGFFNGKDEEFSFCDTYAPLDFGAMRACEARAWSVFNILCEGQFTYVDENGKEVTKAAEDYIEYALGHDKSKRFPLFVKPAKKVTVKAVADVMRDHFEGTAMDMTQDIGAGGNALPYRWRPMDFTYDGQEYCNERAIATQQTGFWFAAQTRSWLPDEIGSLIWFGTDDAATSYLTPIYGCINEIPESLREGNGSMLEYSPTSSFWITNRVANACYKAYNFMQPVVREAIDKWENEQMQGISAIDQQALKLYNKKDNRQLRAFLTDYSLKSAAQVFDKWVKLEQFLLVKFIDGNVKSQNEDGSFVTNGHSDRIPGNIQQPGYTEYWKEAVAKQHGNTIKTN